MKRLLPVLIPAAAVVIAVVLVQIRPEPPRAAPPSSEPAVTVAPVELRSGPIEVIGSGTVRPRAEVDLAMQVGGQVVYVADGLVGGGRVRAGEVLVRVDTADYTNAVRRARADVAQQEVAVLQAEQEADIAADEYRRFVERQRSLGLPVPERPSPLLLREPQLSAARAARDRALAALADAELALSRTGVESPFDGVVRSETVDVGSFVSPGQALGRLYPSDAVEVIVPLTDADAALIPDLWTLEAGDRNESVPATVRVDFGGRRFAWDGYVDRAEAALDEQSRTVDVVVRVPGPFTAGRPAAPDGSGGSGGAGGAAPPLLVGQYAHVTIEGRDVNGYAVLPRSALRPDDVVWVVEEGRVRIVPVRVLQRADEDVYVAGDFGGAARVVTGGLQVATEGMRVRVADPVGG